MKINHANNLFLLSGPLLLWIPLTSFFLHAGYPLFSIEAFLSYLVFAGAGLVGGLLMLKGGMSVRIVVCAVLVTVFIDLQFGWPRLLFVLIGFGGVVVFVWLIRDYLSQILFAFLSITFLTTFFTPTSQFWTSEAATEIETSDSSLPPIFHFILDEHIGIESIPLEVDPDNSIANFVSNSYLDRDFRVYSRAYSVSKSTTDSIPLSLNTSIDKQASVSNRIFRHVLLDDPEYTLSKLKARGYRVNVVQSRFIDFCRPGGVLIVDECRTYDQGNVTAILGEPSNALKRLGYILTSIRHSSRIYELIGYRIGVKTRVTVGPTSTIAAKRGIEKLEQLVSNATWGNVYFAHLLIPHKPYSYNSDCELQTASEGWPVADLRYTQYQAQVRCVTKIMERLIDSIEDSTGLNNATIVIHGDHGSRLGGGKYKSMSFFGTLLVVKMPSLSGGLDRSPISVQRLIRSIFVNEAIPEYDQIYELPKTYDKNLLTPFSHGVVVDSW